MEQMKNLIAALVTLLCTTFCGCANIQGGMAMPKVTPESAINLTRPGSPSELVTNLKAVVDANILVREDTYAEAALTHLTGGDQFRWDRDSEILKMVYISDFPESYAKPEGLAPHKIFCSFQRFDDHVQGQIVVEDLIRSFPLSEMLLLFGNSFTVGDAHAGERIHPFPLGRTSDPNGNKVFDYAFTRGDVKTTIRITSAGDGSIEKISITQRGNK